jgi:cell wall-associated NlpC family hydrolase
MPQNPYLILICWLWWGVACTFGFAKSNDFVSLQDTSLSDKSSIPILQEPQAASSGEIEVDLLIPNKSTQRRDSLVNFARNFIGKPYIYGGTTTAGFDCSGFVQYVYKQFGYSLPRVSGAQAQMGKFVKLEDAKEGDLVYYGYAWGTSFVYTHTAMVYDNQGKKGIRVIHSSLLGLQITPLHFDASGYCSFICIKRIIE